MQHIIIPDSGKTLLRKEIAQAFMAMGCEVTFVQPKSLIDHTHPHYLPELANNSPALFFSINFLGLSHEQFGIKETLRIMQEANGKVAVWCVDNPWNLLSGIRDPKWKELAIFVTDHSFLPSLERHGATSCFHLPLAGSPELSSPQKNNTFTEVSPLVFVGRSSFPEKDTFYKGISLQEEIVTTSQSLLEKGERPDLLWWTEQLCFEKEVFWPGKKQRAISLGAELSSLQWRKICLEHAAFFSYSENESEQKKGIQQKNTKTSHVHAKRDNTKESLDIFGDTGWNNVLSHNLIKDQKVRLFPSVDYYDQLPYVYANARYSLALTSMQLPMGLNQRHFDVWLAGGFCITDATRGLSLFPNDLTEPITFKRPSDICPLINSIESKGNDYRQTLQQHWKEEIRANHLYTHRVEFIFESIKTS